MHEISKTTIISSKIKDKNLNDDILFTIFMRDKEFCKNVLEIILNETLIDIQYHEIEKEFQNLPGYHSIRLDVFVTSISGRIYNIEMQKKRRDNIPKRSRYYQSLIDVTSLKTSEAYSKLPNSIIIFILDYDLFCEGYYKYTVQNICTENGKVLGDQTKKIFLNTKGKNKNGEEDTLIHFLRYVNNTTEENAKSDIKLLKLHGIVEKLKIKREVEDSYMNITWVKEEGREEGREITLIKLIIKKKNKGYTNDQIIDMLELEQEFADEVFSILSDYQQITAEGVFKKLKQPMTA